VIDERSAANNHGDDDRFDIALSDEEVAEAEAAVTLALLPEEERLPTHLRERVEADAKAYFGNRAKVHAFKRAEARDRDRKQGIAQGKVPAAGNMQSTTSAGSQVMAAFADEPAAPVRLRSSSVIALAGWGLAAAACLALFVSQSRGPTTTRRSAGGSPTQAEPVVERFTLTGPLARELGPGGQPVGELRFDRSLGTGVITISGGPTLDAQRESLQLWMAFDGDASPRAITLLEGVNELPFGAGRPVCESPRSGGLSALRCASVREVVVTREEKRGTLVFVADRIVLRGVRTP